MGFSTQVAYLTSSEPFSCITLKAGVSESGQVIVPLVEAKLKVENIKSRTAKRIEFLMIMIWSVLIALIVVKAGPGVGSTRAGRFSV
jgi:hypothetical protein